MSQDGPSSLLVLLVVALFSVSIALLFFAYLVGALGAVGIARERGSEPRAVVLAVVAFLIPVVGWVCLFAVGDALRWARRYVWIGLACLAASAALAYFIVKPGIATS